MYIYISVKERTGEQQLFFLFALYQQCAVCIYTRDRGLDVLVYYKHTSRCCAKRATGGRRPTIRLIMMYITEPPCRQHVVHLLTIAKTAASTRRRKLLYCCCCWRWSEPAFVKWWMRMGQTFFFFSRFTKRERERNIIVMVYSLSKREKGRGY